MKTLKRIFAVSLTLLMLLSVAPLGEVGGLLTEGLSLKASATERSIVQSGRINNDIIWTLDTNGVLEFSGKGYSLQMAAEEMYYCFTGPDEENDTSWEKESVRKIVIDEGVKSLRENSDLDFSDLPNLTEVDIADSVESLPNFNNCTSLTSIVIPESVNVLGSFAGCTSLESITILNDELRVYFGDVNNTAYYNNPDNWENGVLYLNHTLVKANNDVAADYTVNAGTKFIGDSAFKDVSLNSITLPDSVIVIGTSAFENSGLRSIDLSDQLYEIEDRVFWGTQLTELELPESLAFVGKDVFDGTNLPTESENGLTYIADCLTSVQATGDIRVKDGTKYICAKLLYSRTDVNSIFIPGSVKSIGREAFHYCTNLGTIELSEGLVYIGSAAFASVSALEELSIPTTVRTICSEAFYDCWNLSSLSIPEGITDIKDGAFNFANGLKHIDIPSTVKHIGNFAFSQCPGLQDIQLPAGLETIGDFAFAFNYGLKSIDIPNSVVSIGEGAFYFQPSLKSVVLHEGLKSIGKNAFRACPQLTSITIPASVEFIGDNAFLGTHDLQAVTVDSSNAYYTSDARGALFNKEQTKLLYYPLANESTFYSVPQTVQEIDDYAFLYNYHLKCVELPEGLLKIGYYAFGYCSFLENINIPSTLTEISPKAFLHSLYLTKIVNRSSSINAAALSYSCTPAHDVYSSKQYKDIVNYYCNELTYYMVLSYDVEATITISEEEMLQPINEQLEISFASLADVFDAGQVLNEALQIGLPDTLTVYCYENSADHQYCEANNSSYVLMAEDEIVPVHTASEYERADEIPATCMEGGSYVETATCTACGETFTRNLVTTPALGHDWGDWKIATEPTIYSGGEETRICNRDPSHIETREIPPLASFEVTFVVGEETVQTVRVAKGAKYVDEPDLTAYQQDNKTVVWEEYTLNDEDITIHAIITEIDPDAVADKIDTEKTVDQFKNGNATITLSASSPSRLVKFESASTKPVDVIMVLDLSGSMNEKMGSTQTKLQALKDCTNTFLNALNENAVTTGADHRVALVGFASGEKVTGYSITAYQNTGLIVTQDGGFVSYNNANINNSFAKAWLPTGSARGVDERLTAAVNGLTADGSTNTQLGLKMAQNILSTSSGDGREKIVLLITDGVPTSAGNHADEIRAVAPLAITYANEIKNLGVKLYTIGVEASADAEAAFDQTQDGITGTGTYDRINNKNKEVVIYDFNRFLNIVSSNYPNAEAMNNYGEKANSGYYMSVNHTDALNEIFEKVLYSSVYKKLNFQRCTLVDTLSEDFVLTMEQEQALKDNLAQQYNLSDANVMVRRNADGTTTLRIVGVPAVKQTENGKIVYRASVTFEAAFAKYTAGAYATNTEEAYVEVDGERVAGFDIPENVTLNADRNIVVFTLNGTVYRMEEGNLGDVITAPVTDLAKWNIPDGTEIASSYTVFEADEISTKEYTVIWSINGTQTTESYHFGDAIQVPEVADLDDLAFAGFTPWVPATMPARNMTFTATYAPKHVHAFVQTVEGNCKTDLRIVKTCACGETVVEAQPAREHQFSAVVSNLEGNTLTDTLVCSVCGASEQHTLTFQTSKTTWGGTTVLDLSLEQNGTVIQPVAGSKIKIMVPWTNQGYSNTNVKVIRVNENGTQKTYVPTFENGYLIFYADHFSVYLVEELDAQGHEIEPVNYNVAVCELNGTHSYTDVVTAPTCTTGGYTTHTCPSCGDTYTDSEVPAKNHSYGAWTKLDDSQHQRVCANDAAHVEKANHTWNGGSVTKPATCKEAGVRTYTCTACGATKTEAFTNANAHSLTFVPAKSATTEAEGNVAYYHCSLCGKNFSDQNGTQQLTKVTTDKLPQPTEPQKNYNDCKYCGEKHTGAFGWLIKFFHSILAMFGLRK